MVHVASHQTSPLQELIRETHIMRSNKPRRAVRPHRALSSTLLLCATIGLTAVAAADTVSVCTESECDFSSIQAAIAAAVDGHGTVDGGDLTILISTWGACQYRPPS